MPKPKIIIIEPIKVLAVRHLGAYSECGVAWEKLMKFAYTQKMKHGKNLMGKNTRAFGVGYDNPHTTEVSKLRYDACVTMDDEVELDGEVRETSISGGKYIQYLHKGSYETLCEAYNHIFHEWMPLNNLTLRDAPPFEEYLNRDPRRTKPENLRTLLHVPIQ